jgi:mRNA interferase MazF
MVTPAAGKVILVPFPFSDLSQSKLRPAVVLAGVGRGDWILCQINRFFSPLAAERYYKLAPRNEHESKSNIR